jgi:hypothetical protein
MNLDHVDNLNSISKLEALGFEGVDVSLTISLEEYGLAWKKDGNEYLFIHNASHGTNYDRTRFAADLDIYREFDWVNWDAFFRVIGGTRPDFDAMPFPHRIYDLMNYYGVENIFGTTYWEGFTISD